MNPANDKTTAAESNLALSAIAGLETGIIGGVAMLLFLGVHAALRGQSWWSYLNLTGSAIYGNSALWRGVGRATLAGAAIQFVLSGLAGVIFGVCFARTRGRLVSLLIGLSCGVIWFFVTFRLLYAGIAPLVPVYASQPATLLGHTIWGLVVSRTSVLYAELAPAWLPPRPPAETVGQVTAASGIPDASQLDETGEIAPQHRLE